MKRQMTEQEFADRSDVVIRNDGTMQELREQIREKLQLYRK